MSNTPRALASLDERFDAKVERRGADECWHWTGARHPVGHGHFTVDGRTVAAHRFAFERAHGPLQPGELVRHRCDNPPCVNPAHLERGTPRDNVQDGITRGRIHPWAYDRSALPARPARPPRTHCVHGHELTSDNVATRPNGQRDCKACRRESDRRYYERNNHDGQPCAAGVA